MGSAPSTQAPIRPEQQAVRVAEDGQCQERTLGGQSLIPDDPLNAASGKIT
jgi:hypothetical protein